MFVTHTKYKSSFQHNIFEFPGDAKASTRYEAVFVAEYDITLSQSDSRISPGSANETSGFTC